MLKKVMHSKQFLIFVVSFLILSIPCFFYSSTVVPDEVNPLAIGYWLRGEDWSNYLKADGYYYKYGKILFTLPFILLIKRPDVLYKILLLIGTMFVSLIPAFAYTFLVEHFGITCYKDCFKLSFLLVISPAIFLGSKLIWSETYLFLMPWIILWILLSGMDKKLNLKKKVLYSLCLGMLSTYSYMIHTRGVVLLITTTIIVCILYYFGENKNILLGLYFIVIIALLWGDSQIEALIKGVLYGNQGQLTGGSIDFFSKELIQYLFSREGMSVLLTEMVGWIFGSVASTFGLSAGGIFFGFMRLRDYIKKKEKGLQKDIIFFAFFGVCYVGALVLGCLFFFDTVTVIADGNMNNRGDKMIYTRYLDMSNIGLSFYALYYLFFHKEKIKKNIVLIQLVLSDFLLLFFATYIAPKINGTTTWAHILMTLNYFCDLSACKRGGLYESIGEMAPGIILFGIVSLIVEVFVFLKLKENKSIFIFLTGVYLCFGFWNAYHIIYTEDNYSRNIVNGFSDIVLSDEKYKVLFLGDEVMRSSFQSVYYDYYIVTNRDERKTEITDMFIISYADSYIKSLYDKDFYEMINVDTYVDRYHIYIKGDRLNQQMQQQGYETRLVTQEQLD